MRPSPVEIACEVFEGDETKKTLEFPDPNDGFRVHLKRFPTRDPQFLGVELFCVVEYELSLAKNPNEVQALFDKSKLHCEGCNSDIEGSVRKMGHRKKPTA